MINGVLVEMTVKDALPPLKTNTEGLKKVAKDLEEQLRNKQKELEDWKVRFASVGVSVWDEALAVGLTLGYTTEKEQRAGCTVVVLPEDFKAMGQKSQICLFEDR